MSDFTPILKENYKKKKIEPIGYADGGEVVDTLPEGAVPMESLNSGTNTPDVSPNQPEEVQSLPEGAVPYEVNEEKYGTPVEMAKTAAEGAARGVLGHTITSGAEQLAGVSPEDIRGREATNPMTSAGSELAGFAGSMLTGMGEAGILTKAGEAAAQTANVASKIGQAAIKGATEMGIMGADDEVGKLISQDPEASAQSAIVGTGLNAALGAIGGGALAKVGELGGLALMKGQEALKSASESATGTYVKQAIADAVGTVKAGTHIGEPHELAKDELEGLWGQMQGAHSVVDGETGIKASALQKILPEAVTPEISKQAEEASEALNKSLEKMKANPELYPPHLTQNMEDRANRFTTLLDQAGTEPHKVFDAIQELKGDMQKSGSVLSRMTDSDPAYRAIKITQDLGRQFRGMLEDSDTWGKAGNLQKDYNAVASPMISASKDFQKHFMTKLSSGEQIMDDAKIAKFVRQAQDPKGGVQRKILQNFVDTNAKYQTEADKLHAAAGIDREATTPTSVAYLNKLSDETTPGMKIGKAILGMNPGTAAGVGVGTHIGGMILPGAGHVIGAKIGQEALGPIFDSIIQTLKKTPTGEHVTSFLRNSFDKLASQAPSAEALKAALEHTQAVYRGQNIMDKSAKALFAGKASSVYNNDVSDSDLNQLKKRLAYERKTPQDTTLQGASHYDKLATYMPDQAQHMTSSTYQAKQLLQNLKPSSDPKAPLDGQLPVSKQDQARYNNSLRLMQQPNLIMDKLHNGTLTPQDVQLVRSAYPGYYSQMSQKITKEMIAAQTKGVHIPYKLKQGLTMFMGQPMESSLSQPSIAAAQMTHQQPMQRPVDTGGLNASGKKVHAVDKLAAQYQTPEQQRSARANKK